MRIGFDVDGVLTDLGEAWQAAHVKATGRDLFLPGDPANPPVYDWPRYRGYTDVEAKAAMNVIATSSHFWVDLPARPDVAMLNKWFGWLEDRHEVYFITQRFGIAPKRQTEEWLSWQLHTLGTPTVLIVGSGQKGYVMRALKLDCYLEDCYDNARDCVNSAPECRTYLVNRSYNAQNVVAEPIYTRNAALVDSRRVNNIRQFLRAENLIPCASQEYTAQDDNM